jgi:aquaporin Z
VAQSFGFEFLPVFILILVISSSGVRGKAIKDFAGPITGASMNPARSFGPALVRAGILNTCGF